MSARVARGMDCDTKPFQFSVIRLVTVNTRFSPGIGHGPIDSLVTIDSAGTYCAIYFKG